MGWTHGEYNLDIYRIIVYPPVHVRQGGHSFGNEGGDWWEKRKERGYMHSVQPAQPAQGRRKKKKR